jgi:3',5'-cyclic AMP phosphodiesterase CpdA
MFRLAHVSDVHVEAPARWHLGDWFSKRLTSWINLRLLGRGKRFRQTPQVLAALRAEWRERRPDRVVFSGDATALGFPEESARAAEWLGVGDQATPGLAVPGNHDMLTRRADSGHFEQYFAPWLIGERIGTEVYPFAQRVGPAWLVAVNSAVPNRRPTDARGRVGAAQLERLAELLRRLDSGPRILVTHYPVFATHGGPEKKHHALRDLAELIAVARDGGVLLWLHGHRHDAYHHAATADVPFPVICAGSATDVKTWSYGEYTIDCDRLSAVVRVFDSERDGFRDGTTFEVALAAKR